MTTFSSPNKKSVEVRSILPLCVVCCVFPQHSFTLAGPGVEEKDPINIFQLNVIALPYIIIGC